MIKFNNKFGNRKGFTVLELLLVFLLITILASLIYPVINKKIHNIKKKIQGIYRIHNNKIEYLILQDEILNQFPVESQIRKAMDKEIQNYVFNLEENLED